MVPEGTNHRVQGHIFNLVAGENRDIIDYRYRSGFQSLETYYQDHKAHGYKYAQHRKVLYTFTRIEYHDSNLNQA